MGALAAVPTWLTDGSQAAACAAVAFLVHSTVLIALGLLLTVRSRRRSAAFRRAILRITVVAVLASPLASALHRRSGSTRTVAQLPTAPAVRVVPQQADVPRAGGQAAGRPGGSRAAAQGARMGLVASGAVRPEAAAARPAPAEGLRLAPGRPGVPESRYDVFYVGIAAILALGAAGLTFRLARVYARLARASGRAEPAPAGVRREYEQAARSAGTPVPRVLVSRAVRSPLVMGVVRPAVLLPAGAADEQAACSRAIALHELAHVRHRDCLWGLLAQVLCAVAPWQPLVWALARRLGTCQEESCDDYVVWVLGRRREYARELVRVAEVYGVVRQASPAAAGALGYRSRLGRRVSRVLDATRRASPRVKAATVVVLLALGAALLFVTGVLDVGLSWEVPPEVAAQAMDFVRGGDSAGLASLMEEHRSLVKRDGAALLLSAAGKGQVEVCRLLLDAGVSPNRAVNEVTALYSAASGGHEEAAGLLLEAGARPSAQVVGGRTPLQAAAGRGHVGLVRRLLAGGADPNARSEKGTAAIHAAAIRGETVCLQVLLEHGADPGLQDADGRTALHHACAAPDTGALSLLLDAGAEIDAADKEGRTPMHEAVSSAKAAKALFLLERGADLNARTSAGETPLHLAAASGEVMLAHALLEGGADVNARDDNGGTPLGAAARRAEGGSAAATPLPHMQRLLLAHGAEYDAASAVALGSPADVERVVGHAESAPVYPDGSTLLHAAVGRGNPGMVRVLLAKGFDPELRNAAGHSAIDLAIERNDEAMVSLLSPAGSPGAAVPSASLVGAAAEAGEPSGDRTAGEAAEALLEEGREALAPIVATLRGTGRATSVASASPEAPVRVRVPAGPARALTAVRTGSVDTLRQVLDAGADPDEKGQDSQPPLTAAIEAGNLAAVRVLLGAGADVGARDGQGKTPLHWAVADKGADMVRLVLERSPEVDARDRTGATPLLAAVSAGAEEIAELLLAAGADPDAVDDAGRSPLEVAASAGAGSSGIERALVASGARHTIFSAIRCGALEDAKRLLEQDPALARVEDGRGRTPLSYGVRASDGAAVRMLLAAGADPNTRERSGTAQVVVPPAPRRAQAASAEWREAPADTPMLMVAIGAGDEDVVAALLDAGADVRGCRSDGLAPLHMAARAGRAGMIPVLAAAGADPDADAGLGWRPLHEATATANAGALHAALATAGADLNARDVYGRSALRYAVEEGMLEEAQALLDLGAEHDLFTAAAMGTPETVQRLAAESPRSLGLRSASLATPLHVAAQRRRPAVVQALLEAGADPNTRDLSGRSPLHLAAATRNAEVVAALLDGGASADVPSDGGRTPLHVAAERGATEVVRQLLEAGANANAKSEWDGTPLHMAAAAAPSAGGPRVVATTSEGERVAEIASLDPGAQAALLGAGIDAGAPADPGRAATASAQAAGRWEAVQALLKAGADPNAKDGGDQTPLHAAAGAGDMRSVGLLLESGAEADCLSASGATPLVAASAAGAWDVVQALLDAGAGPNYRGRGSSSALFIAAMAGEFAAVSALLEAGAHADSWGEDLFGGGGTALHATASIGRLDIVRLLLDAGADPLMLGTAGRTVLHAAARGKRADVAEALLDAGAPLDLEDGQGCSALHYAVAQGATEVAELLCERGARHDALTATVMGDLVALRSLLAGNPRRAAARMRASGTALHLAAAKGDVEAARLLADALVRAGVGLNQLNGASRTAREVATEKGHDAVVEVLDAAQARAAGAAAPGAGEGGRVSPATGARPPQGAVQ